MEDNKVTNGLTENPSEVTNGLTKNPSEGQDSTSEPHIVIGVVSDCKRLNIRKTPNKEADVVAIVDVDTEMEIINPDRPNTNWYKVNVYEGDEIIRGFCMKAFVTVE